MNQEWIESKQERAGASTRSIPSSVMLETYNFSDDMQNLILACYITKPAKFERFGQVIKPQFFNGLEAVETMLRLRDYQAKYGRMPTFAELGNYAFVKTHRKNPELAAKYMGYILGLSELEIDDVAIEFASEMSMKFARERAIYDALRQIHISQQEGKKLPVDPALLMQQAMEVGLNIEKYPARSAFDFLDLKIPENTCLLGDDFLCRGDGMLYIGPTGGGKSTSSVFQDIHWACGRSAFGINPNGPLKTLHIQAEDNDKRMRSRIEDVIRAIQASEKPFTDQELELVAANTQYRYCNDLTGESFLAQLRVWARDFQPDIIRINPVFSFLGGDAADAKVVTPFLRNGLNPILSKCNAAGILVHHPPKPKRDGQDVKISDYSYTGFGSSEFANWARAILAFEATSVYGTWHFVACKPGPSLGWQDDLGRPTPEKYFAWDSGSWREATEDDLRELEEAEASKSGARKRTGPQSKYDDDTLLAPLCGEPLGLRELHRKLESGGVKISLSTLHKHWLKWIEHGIITPKGDEKYQREGVRSSTANGEAQRTP